MLAGTLDVWGSVLWNCCKLALTMSGRHWHTHPIYHCCLPVALFLIISTLSLWESSSQSTWKGPQAKRRDHSDMWGEGDRLQGHPSAQQNSGGDVGRGSYSICYNMWWDWNCPQEDRFSDRLKKIAICCLQDNPNKMKQKVSNDGAWKKYILNRNRHTHA